MLVYGCFGFQRKILFLLLPLDKGWEASPQVGERGGVAIERCGVDVGGAE